MLRPLVDLLDTFRQRIDLAIGRVPELFGRKAQPETRERPQAEPVYII